MPSQSGRLTIAQLGSKVKPATMPAGIVHSWPMYDEAMGPVLHEQQDICLGGNWPTTIISSCFTYTPAHVEDSYFGAVNDLVYGHPKLWALIPGEGSLQARYIAMFAHSHAHPPPR